MLFLQRFSFNLWIFGRHKHSAPTVVQWYQKQHCLEIYQKQWNLRSVPWTCPVRICLLEDSKCFICILNCTATISPTFFENILNRPLISNYSLPSHCLIVCLSFFLSTLWCLPGGSQFLTPLCIAGVETELPLSRSQCIMAKQMHHPSTFSSACQMPVLPFSI